MFSLLEILSNMYLLLKKSVRNNFRFFFSGLCCCIECLILRLVFFAEYRHVLSNLHTISSFTDQWRVGDTNIPPLAELIIYGVLELDHGNATAGYRDFVINTSYIIILGGRLIIGWEDRPFLGNAHILLQGHWFTQEYFLPVDGTTIGSKVIGKNSKISIFQYTKGTSVFKNEANNGHHEYR